MVIKIINILKIIGYINDPPEEDNCHYCIHSKIDRMMDPYNAIVVCTKGHQPPLYVGNIHLRNICYKYERDNLICR